MDRRTDQIRYEEGEEQYDICQKDDKAVAEAEALQQAFAEQEQTLDSAIDILSNSIIIQVSDNPSPNNIELLDISRFANQDLQKSPISNLDLEYIDDITDQYEFQAQQAKQEQQRKRIQRQNQQEGQKVQELEQQLEEQSRRCLLCFIRGHNSGHSIKDYVQRGSSDIQKGWQDMKALMAKKRQFESFSYYFDCHVPQAMYQKQVQKEQGKWGYNSTSYQFDNIIIPMVMTAMLEGKDWMIMIIKNQVEESGIEFGNQEQMYRWFGQKIDWGSIEASRLVQVFYRLAKGIEIEQQSIENYRFNIYYKEYQKRVTKRGNNKRLKIEQSPF